MKATLFIVIANFMLSTAFGVENQENTVDPKFKKFISKYAETPYAPVPEKMLLNMDPEPDLSSGFTELYNRENLDNWIQRGADNMYEAKGEVIVGTYRPPNANSYLCTSRDDFQDFIFTLEVKWLEDGNSGIQFRSKVQGKDKVVGPQIELEEAKRKRGWSGGIYAQGIGGFIYPLWFKSHEKARGAINYSEWNRITLFAKGETVKTWVNGIPAAHYTNKDFTKGYFALQLHKGKTGLIHFRNIKVKEL
ncbi:MAG: DUF1080 domain-containing protein [Verrucomicrobiota bacterium]